MKTFTLRNAAFALTLLLTVTLMFPSCKKDDDGEKSSNYSADLPDEIDALVEEDIMETIEGMGMPVYRGSNPPSIEGDFLVEDYVLEKSNISTDDLNTWYFPYFLTFLDQDDSTGTVTADYANGFSTGYAEGSFVIGSGNNFSVFSRSVTSRQDCSDAYGIMIFSGTMQSDGIHGFKMAAFMTDNQGNSCGYWIDNGKGRIFNDGDGVAERL